MSTLSAKLLAFLLAFVIGAALVAATSVPADAARKHKKKPVAARAAKVVPARCRGANLFPCGPIYNGQDYLGDDPDPFIRSQILRDLGAHYGGDSD